MNKIITTVFCLLCWTGVAFATDCVYPEARNHGECVNLGKEWCRKNKPEPQRFGRCVAWYANEGCNCDFGSTTSTTCPDDSTTSTTLDICEQPRVCGDMDLDGDVTAVDAVGLLNQAVGLFTTPACECQEY